VEVKALGRLRSIQKGLNKRSPQETPPNAITAGQRSRVRVRTHLMDMSELRKGGLPGLLSGY
jgi:hypothetical protein